MATSMTTDFRRATTWSLVLSILMIVAGVLAIAVPVVAGIAVTALVGWLLVFSGLLHLVFAWRASHASAVVWEVLVGLAYGAIGLYLVAQPLVGLASLTLAVSVYLLFEGVLEFVLSFRLRPARGSMWLLADGIITVLLAAMIFFTWPSSAIWVVGTLIGVSMLFSGFTRLMMTTEVRRLAA
jgi:uncharacterized membrane protein HdeD (DUF308 family)